MSLLQQQPEAAAEVAAIDGTGSAAGAGMVHQGLGELGGGSSSSHAVDKDDFAMGGVAMHALTGRRVVIR